MAATAKQSLFRRLHSASSPTPKWNNERFSRCRGSSGRGARGRGERQRTARCTLQGYFQYAYHLKTYKKKFKVYLSIVLLFLRFCSCIVRKKNVRVYSVSFGQCKISKVRVFQGEASSPAALRRLRASFACSIKWVGAQRGTHPTSTPFLTNNVLSDSRDDVEVHQTRIGPLTQYYNLRLWAYWSFRSSNTSDWIER